MSALPKLCASSLDPEFAEPRSDRLPVFLGAVADHLVLFGGHHDHREHLRASVLRFFRWATHASHVGDFVRHSKTIRNGADFVHMAKSTSSRLTVKHITHIDNVMKNAARSAN